MRRCAALLVSLVASAGALAQQPGFWRLEEIAKSAAPAVTLRKGPDKTVVGTLGTQRARMIVDVKTRLEKEAGVTAELVLIEGKTPNAFSTPESKIGPMVGLNLGMLELLGDDRDAYAAVLGHEYAHLALKHRESRMSRESLRRAGAVLLSIMLATQGIYGGANAADAATQAISMTFSRDEERDADRTGLGYAAAAGFDPYGAVRTWERMATRGDRTVPFLSSHPAPAERVDNMRTLAAELASTAAVTEAEYLPEGVKIHTVLFIESEEKVVVKEMPEDARSTLRAGDRIVGCHGSPAQQLTMWDLASCRSPSGSYAFVVERDAELETAVLLRPHYR